MQGKLTILDKTQIDDFINTHLSWKEYNALLQESNHYFTKAEIVSEGAVGELIFQNPDSKEHEKCVFVFFLGKDQLVIADLTQKNRRVPHETEAMDVSLRVSSSESSGIGSLTIQSDNGDTTDNTIDNTTSCGSTLASDLISTLEREEKELTPVRLFVQILDYTLKNEMKNLQLIETACYRMEELLLDEKKEFDPTKEVAKYRKEILNRNFRYQQFADMVDTLCENPFDIFTDSEKLSFERFGSKVDRLSQQTQLLREYLVQIREMYQQTIDVQHNKTMQVLTVVTTLFFPLTLIAGWYGMNFVNMPELKNQYSYFIVIGLCLIIVVGEIIFFKKKKLIG